MFFSYVKSGEDACELRGNWQTTGGGGSDEKLIKKKIWEQGDAKGPIKRGIKLQNSGAPTKSGSMQNGETISDKNEKKNDRTNSRWEVSTLTGNTNRKQWCRVLLYFSDATAVAVH